MWSDLFFDVNKGADTSSGRRRTSDDRDARERINSNSISDRIEINHSETYGARR